ncbi:hypothetical protein [Oryzomonas rubra]|uniref:Uncharacterized protein n=1 Tax=Oryzomonas rubra TaxID=2509454 RepID=A0A5A9X8E2_9BACT|nr:hypothetical protein [Oryzomonas rubra]KAA0889074.1 hypothetical protein ET418_14585 [Oryzomonas rubra]
MAENGIHTPGGAVKTIYNLLTQKYVSVVKVNGKEMLHVDTAKLANTVMRDASFMPRTAQRAVTQNDKWQIF